MKTRHLIELLMLAALWGASFLFMRIAAPAFGAVPLAGVRVVGASLILLPLLVWRGELRALRRHAWPILVVGVTNSALPFLCFGLAATAITGGLSAVFNATTPLWGAVIGGLWLKERLTGHKVVGLLIGFAGVLLLAWDKVGFKADPSAASATLAISACLSATCLYGFSANFTKRYLSHVSPMAMAAGSQLSAGLLLLGPACWLWPKQNPEFSAWLAALGLAVLCTALAYLLFFRLVSRIGASNTITVTFLIPAFAMLWGYLLLDEQVNLTMGCACAVIVVGTSLVTGWWQPRVLASRPR